MVGGNEKLDGGFTEDANTELIANAPMRGEDRQIECPSMQFRHQARRTSRGDPHFDLDGGVSVVVGAEDCGQVVAPDSLHGANAERARDRARSLPGEIANTLGGSENIAGARQECATKIGEFDPLGTAVKQRSAKISFQGAD